MFRFAENTVSDSLFAESDQFSLSSGQYINWVKRSLNRQFGTSMPGNGVPSDKYRNQVRLFQRKEGRPETGHVDKQLQNIIIMRNEGNRSYMTWVWEVLASPKFSIITDGPLLKANSKGSLKSAMGLESASASFQKKYGKEHDLKVDGFVGAQTEAALMSLSRTKPPGYVAPRRRRKQILKPTITLKPMTSDEMRQAIFFILGRHPVNNSLKRLFGDLAKNGPKVRQGISQRKIALARFE